MNDDTPGTYSLNSQIKLKTTILNSILCDYSGYYRTIKRTITIVGEGAD